jgi:transposase-like protein
MGQTGMQIFALIGSIFSTNQQLRNVSKKWTMPFRDWKAALNQFIILFGDRVPV